MATLPTEELVRRCQRSLPEDTRPFELLVGRYKERVFATAYRLMGNYHDAEEQAQEVFVKVYRGIKDLGNPATVSSWIYRITTTTCLDALEKRRARRPAPLGDEAGGAPDPAGGPADRPEERALRAELRRCVEATLWQLEPAERAVLVLRDVEGRPYQEVADAVGAGLSAVKMRIHRARLAFQRLFQTLCPGLYRPAAGGRSASRDREAEARSPAAPSDR